MATEYKRVRVNEDNIEEIRDAIAATDQRNEIRVGQVISTWPIVYEPGQQRGQMTIWHDTDRGACCHGGDSLWGDWSDPKRVLCLEESGSTEPGVSRYEVDEDGHIIPIKD